MLQVEGHETRTTPRSRGGSRFNSKAIEGLEASTTTPFSSLSPEPSRARSSRRGAVTRGEDAKRQDRIETTTLKSRLDHDRNIKLTAGNGRKSGVSPPPTVTSKSSDRNSDRRRVAASRKPTTEAPQRETSPTYGTVDIEKIRKSTTEIPAETKTTTDSSAPSSPPPTNPQRKFAKPEIPVESEKVTNNQPEVPKDNQEPRRIARFRTRKGESRRGSPITTQESYITQNENPDNTKNFDTTGPSVFSANTEIPRSRTGRKIQTTLSSRDLKKGLPAASRFSSLRKNSQKRNERSGTAEKRSDDSSVKRRHDIVPSGSESVVVDIPLTGELTSRVRTDNFLSSSESPDITRANRKTRSRGRSNEDQNSEAITSRSGSRRGSSRQSETKPSENLLEKTGRSRSEGPRSRNLETKPRNSEQSTERSRKRGRSQDVASSSGRSSEKRGRISPARSSTGESNTSNSEGRGRSRIIARTVETTTSFPVTTAIAEEVTVTLVTAESIPVSTQVSFTSSVTRETVVRDQETTTESRGSKNRGRITSTTDRPQQKEDFFNHGLGFRGRKIATEAPPTPVQPAGTTTEAPPRGNPGWTLKRRPGYHQEETTSTTATPNTTTQSGSVTISNEIPTSNDVAQSTPSGLADNSTKARGSKKPVRPANDKGLRGSKTFDKIPGHSKVNGESDEGDNYPPEFKARLATLVSAVENMQILPTLFIFIKDALCILF